MAPVPTDETEERPLSSPADHAVGGVAVRVVRTFGRAGSPIRVWKDLRFAVAPVPGMTLECDGGVTGVVADVFLRPQTHPESVRPGIVAYLVPEHDGNIMVARADGWVDVAVGVRGLRSPESPRAR